MTKKKKVSKHQQYSNTMHLHPPACTITKKGQAYLRLRTVYVSDGDFSPDSYNLYVRKSKQWMRITDVAML